MFGIHFYNKTLMTALTAFGLLFSKIKILRTSSEDEAKNKVITIPIEFASKEKYVQRLFGEPDFDKRVQITLPRMSFDMQGLNYDSSKNVNRIAPVRSEVDEFGNRMRSFSPTPYIIDLNLNILSRNLEDMFQIVEQILPTFRPEYTMSLNLVPSLITGQGQDVPVILTGISPSDEYEGEFESKRIILYTLSFQMKVNFFGDVTNQGLITHANANVSNSETLDPNVREYRSEGDLPTQHIIDRMWSDVDA